MFRVQWAAKTARAVFFYMPLLTELGWNEDGLNYKHGAPNGALRPGQNPVPLKTAKNLNSVFAVFGVKPC
jgi:hypothetical protein